MSRAIRHSVIGGLGNQLFCFAAALFFLELHGGRLILYVDKSRKPNLLDLIQIPVEIEIRDHSKLLTKLSFLCFRILNRLNSITRILGFGTRLFYFPSQVGFDTSRDNSKKPYFTEGYFQSYLYPDSLKKISIKNLVRQDINFMRVVELGNFENSIAIHIRRGDYRNPENSYFGMLSREFYFAGIEKLLMRHNYKSIFVFSDEIERIKDEFTGLSQFGLSVNWVSKEYHLSTVQELMLFSKAKGKVMGNSTFAWWGAYLGEENAQVICPDKWFKDRDDPVNLLPGNWERLESNWLNR